MSIDYKSTIFLPTTEFPMPLTRNIGKPDEPYGLPHFELGPRVDTGKSWRFELRIGDDVVRLHLPKRTFDKLTVAAQGKRIQRAIDNAVRNHKAKR